MKFNTIHELVDSTKVKIQELNHIVDVLLSEYRAGADIIDQQDHRKRPLDQFQELNAALDDIVNTHPASKQAGVNLTHQNAEWIKNIAYSEKAIAGTPWGSHIS